MSKSDDERREDKRRTLMLMLSELGDQHIWQGRAVPSQPPFSDVLQTTWRELMDDGLIEDKLSTMGQSVFRLTPHGWIRAVTISGQVDASAMRESCTKLVRALKAVVKGRGSHYDEFTSVDAIASSAGLSMGFVFNAVKSRLLGVVFPDDRWDAALMRRVGE
jgi:hypothetical protein